MTKIAIISERDNIWALPVWQKTIPILQKNGIEIVGMWICPAKLGRFSGVNIPKWYFTTFGTLDFIRLSLFSLFSQLRRQLRKYTRNGISNFASLAKHYEIDYYECEDPNDTKMVTMLKYTQVEILITWVGYILKKQILEIPRTGSINKHASILPSYQGLFPYLWAYIDAAPQGVSFHVMTENIYEGKILVQQDVPKAIVESSMVKFYLYVYQNYSQMLLEAIRNLISGNFIIPQETSVSTFGLPNSEDINNFRKAGGNVIRWQDIFKAL
ncbi:MAG: formyltransferase family protein [Nitrospinota bacterium]|nr:formyltransferase family protein [Nitrospinota bacterium]